MSKAANRFDPDRGVSFKTFFFYHLRGMLLKEISRVIQEQKLCQFIPSTAVGAIGSGEHVMLSKWAVPLVEHNNPERILAQREVARLCWKACSTLDDLEQEVIVRSFAHDEPLVDIAKELGYCRCHISRVKTAALTKLGKILEKSLATGDQRTDKTPLFKTKRAAGSKARARKRKSYSGGRGRRKQIEDDQAKLDSLSKLLKKVATG